MVENVHEKPPAGTVSFNHVCNRAQRDGGLGTIAKRASRSRKRRSTFLFHM